MTALVVPPHLTARQHLASDPKSSIWVSANAGSGKTHVLTQRVMRLLLMGVPPSKILCLTFTKAAAAEMSARVFRELSKWTALDDGPLREKIIETGAPAPDAKDLVLARRLFTRTVETPGGLKIQTIHAFCERLLHLFPFEANVPAHFEVADDKRTEEMLSLARYAAIADAQRRGGPQAEALATLAEAAGSLGLDPVLGVAMRLRKAAKRVEPDPQHKLAAALGAGNLVSVDDVHRVMIEGIATARWREIAAYLATGSRSDVARAAELEELFAALRNEAKGADLVPRLLAIFFTQKGDRRGSLMTRALATKRPDILADLEDEQTRLLALREQLKVAEAIDRTQALVTIVDAIIDRYDAAKGAAGLLDFDDLIDRTRGLLERSDAGWVLHKLDAGIDHVLVDEAQDTSEAQWRILEKLTDDFAAGAGARQTSRSFFVVGDEKQSIFSFQGAAPLMFDGMRSRFERRFKQGGEPFARVALNASFRSTPGILAAVDEMFEPAPHRDGLVAAADDWTPHESLKPTLPSLVEIWPPIGATATTDPEDWKIPLDLEAEDDPVSKLADRVARKIKALTAPASGEHVHDARTGLRREISAGDILVLVRTRNAFFEAVIRALKAHGVPVAGADRLDVANHIAVMDLVAAGRAALLPDDDLSLACALKSPLFGFTDDDLLALAPNRKGPLVAALAASGDPRHKAAHEAMTRWAARAAGASPFAFYVELLGRDGGRLKMEARLGPEAHDAIDEFLRLALEHEATGAPSLTSFLADVEALDSSIKRDMEGQGGTVRVMTVHAAKGLEAKIVFLPDTCAVPTARLDPPVFDLAAEGAPPLIAWSPRSGDDPAPIAEARKRQREASMREYRRLLYVAMTRAEERLYLAAFYNIHKPPEDCWSAMAETVFGEAETVAAFWDEAEVVRRIHRPGAPATGAAPRAQH
ncbi:MAG: double-strand break repair helicase AddA, partial [Beijerinckiaceae bacterium]|nr:double-strand break repair helicase AddA [Beijerinckiaceae bacterium]